MPNDDEMEATLNQAAVTARLVRMAAKRAGREGFVLGVFVGMIVMVIWAIVTGK